MLSSHGLAVERLRKERYRAPVPREWRFFLMPFLPFKHRGRSLRPAGMHCPLWLGCNSQCDACWRPGFAPRLLLGARQLQATQNPLIWSSVGNSSIRWVHLQHYERVLLPSDVHSSSVPLHPAPAYDGISILFEEEISTSYLLLGLASVRWLEVARLQRVSFAQIFARELIFWRGGH